MKKWIKNSCYPNLKNTGNRISETLDFKFALRESHTTLTRMYSTPLSSSKLRPSAVVNYAPHQW